MNLTLELSNKVGYGPRTRENVAQSDMTLAIASDFSTAGERLTLKCAKEHGRTIIQVPHNAIDFDKRVDWFIYMINTVASQKQYPLTLNGAGNGVYTLESKRQEDADAFAFKFMQAAIKHTDKRFMMALVRSGGQTGYDVAIVKAAMALGIPAMIHCARTKGGKFLIRGADGRDMGLTEQEYRSFMFPEPEKIWICGLCGAKFTNKAERMAHERMHP
jgi:hypothetical protein